MILMKLENIILFPLAVFTTAAFANESYEFELTVNRFSENLPSYVSVHILVANNSDQAISYYIHDAELMCPDSEHEQKGSISIIQPSTSWRSSGGILLPGSGRHYTPNSTGSLKIEFLGLLGPLEDISDCVYSLSVTFYPLRDSDFSVDESRSKEIVRRVELPNSNGK